MGRKSISGARKSDRPLRIRLTDEERAQIDSKADAEGKPVSAWARETLLRASRPKK